MMPTGWTRAAMAHSTYCRQITSCASAWAEVPISLLSSVALLRAKIQRMSSFDLKVFVSEFAGSGRVLSVHGEIKISNMEAVQDALRAEQAAAVIIVDLTQVTYLDSAGIGLLANTQLSAQKN